MPVVAINIDRANLSEAMQLRGLSYRELARRAGISEATVARAARGSGLIRDRSFNRILAALAAVPELPAELRERLEAR
jgi:transcriptional regulator with XRE-family HTH domain